MATDQNLLTNPRLREGEGDVPEGWILHAELDGMRAWWERPTDRDVAASLAISHCTGGLAGWWEQRLEPAPAGRLVRLSAQVRGAARGAWLIPRIVLQALGPDGEALASVEEALYLHSFGTPSPTQGDDFVELRHQLVVPNGTQTLVVRVGLYGQGTVWFTDFQLWTETADVRRLHQELVDRLKHEGTLQSPEIEAAFRQVPRHLFLPGHNWAEVYSDRAVMTRFPSPGSPAMSSSSQPTVMAMMLERLDLRPGMRVLEVGAGTGYNAALLSRVTGNPELVWTVDAEEDLCEEARQHLEEAECAGVHVRCGNGWDGYPEAAPYDRILVTAQAHDLSPAWFEQLAEGGLLLVPWGPVEYHQRTIVLRKAGETLVLEGSLDASFMPLRGSFRPAVLREKGRGMWQADWRTPDELERIRQLLAGPPWQQPCPLLEGQRDLRPFLFYLSVEEPRLVTVTQRQETGSFETSLVIADETMEAACGLDLVQPGRLSGWGGSGAAGRMLSLVEQWFAWGQPTPDRLRLVAYPPGAEPHPGGGERLLCGPWFRYAVAWDYGPVETGAAAG